MATTLSTTPALPSGQPACGAPLPPEELGDSEGEVDGLAGVQPGVASRRVPQRQLLFEDLADAAEALGDVVAGQLDMDSAGPRALWLDERRRSPGSRRARRRNAVSCGPTRSRRCCRASDRRPTPRGGRPRTPLARSGGSASSTRSTPIRLTNVRRPGARSGFSRSQRAIASSGVDGRPELDLDRVPDPRQRTPRARRPAGGCAPRSRRGGRSSRTSRP